MSEFNHKDSLKSEECAMRARDKVNEDVSDYNLFNPWITSKNTKKCEENIEKIQDFSTQNYMNIRDGVGITNACRVDTDDTLRKLSLTHSREPMQLETRVFKGSPFVANGTLNNTDIESALLQGDNTYNVQECGGVSVTDNIFQPLLPCLQDTIQDPKHIIPPWTRGGESTRDTLKQQEFLEQNGYQLDGNVWTKKTC